MAKRSASIGKRGGNGDFTHCFECDQTCCKTAVIEVESPRSLRDYSDLMFYLYHFETQLVIAHSGRKKEWYVEFMTPCMYLDAGGRCTVYEKRPLVCREYDMNYCERNTRYPIAYLRTPAEFLGYLRNQGRMRVFRKLSETHHVGQGRPLEGRPKAAGLNVARGGPARQV